MFRSVFSRAGGAVLATLATVALALPAAASADASVEVTGGKNCYASFMNALTQPIHVKARGLKPGLEVRVELRIDEETVSGTESLTVDSDGRLISELGTWTTGFPDGPTGPNDAQIVVTDFLLGHVLASTGVTVANTGLYVTDDDSLQGTPRSWIISGLSLYGGGTSYYAHYFTTKPRKQFATVRLGPSTGKCGYLKVRKPLMPQRRIGKFEVWVQNYATYQKDKSQLGGRIKGYLVKP